jgi:hypothetical protein
LRRSPDLPKWEHANLWGLHAPNSDLGRAVISYLVGTALFALGISWHRLKPALGPRLSETLGDIASDFRWWVLIFGIAFLYLGYPNFSRIWAPSAPIADPQKFANPSPMADPQKTASPSPIADPLVPVTLSPEFLSGLTNEDLRRVA